MELLNSGSYLGETSLSTEIFSITGMNAIADCIYNWRKALGIATAGKNC
jgi:hypothetical protein